MSTEYDNIEENQDDEEEVVQVSYKIKPQGSKKYASSVTVRSQEEYESWIESIHYETLIDSEGKEYQVKVTVLKPAISPMESLKPAYAYSSSF